MGTRCYTIAPIAALRPRLYSVLNTVHHFENTVFIYLSYSFSSVDVEGKRDWLLVRFITF